MFNMANMLHLFNKLITEKYPDLTTDELSPRDYEIANQLVEIVELLKNSTEYSMLILHYVSTIMMMMMKNIQQI